MKAGLSFSLFIIPSAVSSNSARLPLQRQCDFEDMLLFRHESQESKSMASSKLPLGSRPPESPDRTSAEISLQLSQPGPRQQVHSAAGDALAALFEAMSSRNRLAGVSQGNIKTHETIPAAEEGQAVPGEVALTQSQPRLQSTLGIVIFLLSWQGQTTPSSWEALKFSSITWQSSFKTLPKQSWTSHIY